MPRSPFFLAPSVSLLFLLLFPPPGLAGTPAGEAAGPAMALSAPPDPRSPSGVAIPKDLDAALFELDRIVPSPLKEDLRSLPEPERGGESDLGRWVKANWGLYQGSVLARWFEGAGVYPPDDMAGVLLAAFRARLRGEPFQLDPLLERFGVRTVPASALPPVELGLGKRKETVFRFTGWGFVLDLPVGGSARVRDRDGKSGYAMATLYGPGGGHLLAIYSGGHPSYPAQVPPRIRIRKGSFAGRPAEWSEWKKDGRHYKEIKLEMPGDSPGWLHLWYHGLTAAERQEAEKLLGRLRPGEEG